MYCPYKTKYCSMLVAGIVAGTIILQSCHTGFRCEYLPHEDPKPKYFPPPKVETATIVASSSGLSADIPNYFRVNEMGPDPTRPGYKVYFLNPRINNDKSSSGNRSV